jgi:hypothetical protein
MLKYYDWNEKRLVKYYDWERAEALYKIGKSSRQIENETGIPHATVIRKANAEGWVKGELIPLIRRMTVTANFLSYLCGNVCRFF